MDQIKRRLVEGLDGRPLTWLAEKTGDTYKNLQRWVNGNVVPPLDFIPRFCEATGLALDWVMAGRLPKFRREPGIAELALDLIREVAQAEDRDMQEVTDTWAALMRAKERENPPDGNGSRP